MKMKKLLALVMTLVMLTACTAAQADAYSAASKGFGGDVTVELTIEAGKLTGVKIEGPSETEGIGTRAMDLLSETFLATNSIEADAVSGATLTSNAILSAAAEALAASGQTLTAVEAEIVQKMTPGTYYGEAYGKWAKGTIEGERFGSPAIIQPTKVAVTVDETSILSVEVLETSDNPGYIEPVIERIPAAVVAQQSIAVDVVTGCTMTSQAVLSGVSQALEQAGANLVGFNKPTPKVEALEEYTTDFVVVGAGGSGSAAALRAIKAGLDVIVIEKCGKVGGESVASTGMLTYGSKHLQKESGVEPTPINVVFNEMMEWASYKCSASVVMAFLENNGPAADMMAEHWAQTTNKGYTKMAPKKNGMDTGKGTDKYNVLYDKFIKPGANQVMLETTAYELILDGDTVVGVKARKQDGTEVVVHAKAVLLATGGYAGNPEMLRKYLHTDDFYLYGLSTNTGDGLNMALAAGAGLNLQMSPHFAEFCSNLKVDFYAGYMKFANYMGHLQVDPEGRRFYNEEKGASDPLAKGTSALGAVGFAYAIFSQDDLDKMEKEGAAGLLSEEVRAECTNYRPRACVPFYTIKTEMQNAIDAGEGWKADTLKDLGAQIGFDPVVWKNTIDAYLGYIETGVDEQFGKRKEMLFPLSEGPFYAVRIYPALDGTLNGVPVNSNMQALNTEYRPIEGLYMGGYDAGSVWGPLYYQTEHTNALTQGWAITSGYIAAGSVIEKVQGK